MKLNYKQFGSGEPLVILHGLFGSLDNWQSIAKKLALKYQVFIVDLRNHGKSPHSKDFDYEIMAEDIVEFLDDNWIFECYLMGHSMGGKIAMQIASTHPDLVKKLIVVDIAPKKYLGNHEAIFQAMFNLDLINMNRRKELDEALMVDIPDFGIRQFIIKNLAKNKNDGYRWKLDIQSIYDNYDKIIGAVPCDDIFEEDTLFIKGENSDYILKKDWSSIQEQFPLAKLVEIPQTGHWVHAQAPQKVIEVVEGFLS